ncbi:MAG TPA: hypothetical protein P5199_12145 [Thermoanaerobaculia bacterium]|jgi:hypothetical protein|nr:hypothetical protein [Acidobacteriota bacterium]OQC36113.1 MAG: hypothetical protein BWX64_02200 [Acidobacteria bacterium ADurb.Bin051]HRS37220.1 hypothetical protein [Thermoanaerobaculia bacterium]
MAHELWWPAFEAAYRRTATIAVSAELAGVRRTTVYEALRRRPDLRERLAATRTQIASDRARHAARRAEALIRAERR